MKAQLAWFAGITSIFALIAFARIFMNGFWIVIQKQQRAFW